MGKTWKNILNKKNLFSLQGTQFLIFLELVDSLVLEYLNEVNSSFSDILVLKIVSCPKLQPVSLVFVTKF